MNEQKKGTGTKTGTKAHFYYNKIGDFCLLAVLIGTALTIAGWKMGSASLIAAGCAVNFEAVALEFFNFGLREEEDEEWEA